MLHAGVAHHEITPPVGTRLSGFAGRPTENFASTGVRDRLRATALWLHDGITGALIVSLDTIGLTPRDDRRLRQRLAQALGCALEAVVLSCSHTHSGAATMEIRATGAKEVAWTREVQRRVVKAAQAAKAAAVPVTCATVGSAPTDAAVNRRRADGPRDPLVRTLLLESAEGPLVLLFHAACHPVALGNQNTLLSADWVAAARAILEPAVGCPLLFLQACCGDINPQFRDEARSSEQADRVGRALGEAALEAQHQAQPLSLTPIRAAHTTARLPLQPYPTPEALVELEAAARERLQELGRSDVDQAYLEWVQAVREKPARRSMAATVSVLRLGALTLTGMPGEIFSELSLALPESWVLGFTNGNLGYLYPDSALTEGGYEVTVAYKLYGEQALAAGAGAALLRAARRAAQST